MSNPTTTTGPNTNVTLAHLDSLVMEMQKLADVMEKKSDCCRAKVAELTDYEVCARCGNTCFGQE